MILTQAGEISMGHLQQIPGIADYRDIGQPYVRRRYTMSLSANLPLGYKDRAITGEARAENQLLSGHLLNLSHFFF